MKCIRCGFGISVASIVILALLAALAGLAVPASARTWTVNALGTGQAETIQAAIDAASNDDVIQLEAGIYTGPGNRDIDFGGKSITVTSIDGSAVTTIDCEGLGRGFIFQSGETSSSQLSAVTITNGTHASFGGAIYCVSSSPSIEDVVFYSNGAGIRGGAVYCDASNATIDNNEFEDNDAAYGGALWCSGSSSLTVTNNEFVLNTVTVSGGAIGCRGSSPTIDGNTFEQNQATFDGGAIQCDQTSAASITNNTFHDNNAGGNGGGVAYDDSPLSIQYNVFWENTGVLGGGVYGSDLFGGGDVSNNTFDSNAADNGAAICYTNNSRPPVSNNVFANSTNGEAVFTKNDSSPTISCCCFYNNAGGDALPPGSYDGGGNFVADPEYCGVDGSGNFYLQADSPCIPGINHGGTVCTLVGALSIDCGTTSTKAKTWGAIKEMYRGE